MKAEWIATSTTLLGLNNVHYMCSNCGHHDDYHRGKAPYCWFCGSKMVIPDIFEEVSGGWYNELVKTET